MLWAPVLVLASALNAAPVRAPAGLAEGEHPAVLRLLADRLAAVSALGGALASTYDEAACAADAVEPPVAPVVEEARCSEPPPAAPAVIDCNDPGMSKWVGEMIGSCDMPKPSPMGGAPSLLRPVHDTGAPVRICDTFGCRHESAPLRAIGRPLGRPDPGLGTSVVLEPPRGDSALSEHAAAIPSDPLPRRLERPPRA